MAMLRIEQQTAATQQSGPPFQTTRMSQSDQFGQGKGCMRDEKPGLPNFLFFLRLAG